MERLILKGDAVAQVQASSGSPKPGALHRSNSMKSATPLGRPSRAASFGSAAKLPNFGQSPTGSAQQKLSATPQNGSRGGGPLFQLPSSPEGPAAAPADVSSLSEIATPLSAPPKALRDLDASGIDLSLTAPDASDLFDQRPGLDSHPSFAFNDETVELADDLQVDEEENADFFDSTRLRLASFEMRANALLGGAVARTTSKEPPALGSHSPDDRDRRPVLSVAGRGGASRDSPGPKDRPLHHSSGEGGGALSCILLLCDALSLY
jgi:hypothetical protein